MTAMHLYYSPNSPYARKVRVMLAELGVKCELRAINLDDPPPEFPKANPNLRVPCLVDGPRTVFESGLIQDYLLRTCAPRPSAPGQLPLARSLTRPAQHWADLLALTTIETLLDSALLAFHLQRDGIAPEASHTLRRELMRVQSELDWLEANVGDEGFMPGVFSVQDLNLAVTLAWMDFRKPVEWRGRPRLEALLARHENRPSLRDTRPGQ